MLYLHNAHILRCCNAWD